MLFHNNGNFIFVTQYSIILSKTEPQIFSVFRVFVYNTGLNNEGTMEEVDEKTN